MGGDSIQSGLFLGELLKQIPGLENPLVYQSVLIALVLMLSWLVYYITHRVIIRTLQRVVERSATNFDDLILDKVVSRRLSYIAPVLVLYYFANLFPEVAVQLRHLLNVVIGLILLLSAGALLNQLTALLEEQPYFQGKPVKSYTQIAKLVMYLIGGIFLLGLITGTSPLALISGLGAMTAILILIFRDTILSFIASVHISNNDLVHIGDWIEVGEYGADGTVIDIALHTIKVQNWDKTITVIPTYKLIDVTFKNWRGMKQSGGRRIKRSINLDMNSIRFCDQEMLQRFRRIDLIKEYLEKKESELASYNANKNVAGATHCLVSSTPITDAHRKRRPDTS